MGVAPAVISVVCLARMTPSHARELLLTGERVTAQRVLDAAEGIVEALHGKMEAVLVQARDVGAAIVDEAASREADLLILGLPYRTRFGGDFAIGRAVPYALKNAPCMVWVVREPMGEESR